MPVRKLGVALGAMFLGVFLVASPASSHFMGGHCHAHLFAGGPAKPEPGCIQQGGRIYLPAECRTPSPPKECVAWRQRGERLRSSLRPPPKPTTADEPGKGRATRLYD